MNGSPPPIGLMSSIPMSRRVRTEEVSKIDRREFSYSFETNVRMSECTSLVNVLAHSVELVFSRPVLAAPAFYRSMHTSGYHSGYYSCH